MMPPSPLALISRDLDSHPTLVTCSYDHTVDHHFSSCEEGPF